MPTYCEVLALTGFENLSGLGKRRLLHHQLPFPNTIQHQSITPFCQTRQVDAEAAFPGGKLSGSCAGGLALGVDEEVGEGLGFGDGEGDGSGAFCWIGGDSDKWYGYYFAVGAAPVFVDGLEADIISE